MYLLKCNSKTVVYGTKNGKKLHCKHSSGYSYIKTDKTDPIL